MTPIQAQKISIELVRQDPCDRPGTPGELIVWAGDDILFECHTLELDWKDNEKDVSCVPEGDYTLEPRSIGGFAARARNLFGWDCVPWIRGVPDRDFILCHWGNFLGATRGCVLLGERPGVHAGANCVWQSKKACRRFYKVLRPYMTDPLGNPASIPFTIRDGLAEEEADLSADRSDI